VSIWCAAVVRRRGARRAVAVRDVGLARARVTGTAGTSAGGARPGSDTGTRGMRSVATLGPGRVLRPGTATGGRGSRLSRWTIARTSNL
jgi:hypothetical protein